MFETSRDRFQQGRYVVRGASASKRVCIISSALHNHADERLLAPTGVRQEQGRDPQQVAGVVVTAVEPDLVPEHTRFVVGTTGG